jgi:hypothetical protein
MAAEMSDIDGAVRTMALDDREETSR